MATSIENKISILSELWQQYKNEPKWSDFFDYNDIGLPMSFMLEEAIVKETEVGIRYINETFDLLLATLSITDDKDFEDLDDVLNSEEVWEEDENE